MSEAVAVAQQGERAEAAERGWLRRADGRAALLLVFGLAIVRIVYLFWLCPWDLVQDEAHYWEWSRRLSLSYYSKGPGVAWSIWLATAIFGDAEWAIRLPAVIFHAIGALALGRLTIDLSGDERAGFAAAALFSLIPIYQLEGQLMTIDGPFVALWTLSALTGWRAFRRHEARQSPWGLWALTGLLLGIGFLYKYTIVLLPPAFLAYAVIRRKQLPWDRRLTLGAILVVVTMVAAMSPVIIWNAHHDWPTYRHTLGHLGAPGGDVPTQWNQPFGGFSTIEFVASQIGVIGPPALILMIIATQWAVRRRREQPGHWPHRLYLLVCGIPTIVFFLAVSLVSRVEANWPVAGYVTLIALAAEMTLARNAGAGPGGTGRRVNAIWPWIVGFGIFTLTVVMFPNLYARIPVIGDLVPMYRIQGATQLAGRVEGAMKMLRQRTGKEPIVISASYGKASQLAYYLPGRPTVYGAGRYVGRRGSQYDYFPDTDLSDPALRGRPAVLVLKDPEDWQRRFELSGVQSLGGTPAIHVAEGYYGPRGG